MSADGKFPLNWFDLVVVAVLVVGVLRGRKRGMSQELVDVIQWIVIIGGGAYLYLPIGQWFAETTSSSQLFSYVAVYIGLAILIKLLFLVIRRGVGGKLVGSDVFKGAEWVKFYNYGDHDIVRATVDEYIPRREAGAKKADLLRVREPRMEEQAAIEDVVRMRMRQAQLYWLLGDEAADARYRPENPRPPREVLLDSVTAALFISNSNHVIGWLEPNTGDATSAQTGVGARGWAHDRGGLVALDAGRADRLARPRTGLLSAQGSAAAAARSLHAGTLLAHRRDTGSGHVPGRRALGRVPHRDGGGDHPASAPEPAPPAPRRGRSRAAPRGP